MEEIILSATEDEGIASLYSLIRGDPDFLQTFDRSQFADTPLHRAAGEGCTQLALEIQRLMPSFGRKLNPDGLTAVDLAMRRGHRQTVRALVKLSPELVGVQGREGITPLHYAAETDDAELLQEFLFRCPKSVEELTVREESAVHVAVKNRKLAAVRVLVTWLQKTGRINVLEWKDCNGDTVLHLATSTNQPED
ncbi:PREDICTED: receptor-interacting serine/threonine-protein kinase 4-like [Erythranthe guttata]|uniref:receptor-interacting serine/threonine-protein kinase 4-like n=1 Tax=Erythranthe guttata TaxID=4155 RepID=UPI00064D896F|nr:PREDICTED: receptor-interacting serine/threonine-protein kinase 4-like [Erythranthe guttata]|eukprot:XP_012834232.1 PREDICTED: receptor-interacting serine/threonine-protein kinase 4-like [Erythranthe guttata]